MKPSVLFRIKRAIQFLLRGVGKLETEHHLFTLSGAMSDIELYTTLAWHGWTPNYLAYIYKGQIYQCRRLTHGGKHQYHVRFYSDGGVTGHFEIAPEYDTSDHLSGVDLRTMTIREASRLKEEVEGIRRLKEKYNIGRLAR